MLDQPIRPRHTSGVAVQTSSRVKTLTAPSQKAEDSQFTEDSLFTLTCKQVYTFSPRADTASPAAKTLRAALMSRSWIVSHSGQVHWRTFKGILATVCPQSEQRLLLGYQRSIPTSSRPYHSDLYSNCRTNSDQLASAIDVASYDSLMLLTANVSMAITWFSFTRPVESLWRKSLRDP